MPDTHSPYDPKQEAAQKYRTITRLIERLHRLYLDVIRAELARMGVDDINAVQALLLTNIGSSEVNVKTLMERGYYQGSNANYNLKKLVESGYIERFKSPNDLRATMVRLTPAGHELSSKIQELETALAETIDNDHGGLGDLLDRLGGLENAWSYHIRVCSLGG